MSVQCHVCDAETKAASPVSWCQSCGAMLFPAAKGPEVLVAHGSEPLALQIGQAVAAAGMRPLRVVQGTDAMRLIETRRPPAAVLDVALAEIFAFQLIERLRASPAVAATKVILVASVFNKTAYKRRPSSLYGADDYVEQHHIVDHLPERLCRLLGLPAPALGDVASRRAALSGHDLPDAPDEGARARLMARNIVADIALYSKDEIGKAVNGDWPQGLRDALDEGRRLLAARVDPRSYAGQDPILDAFLALLRELREVRP